MPSVRVQIKDVSEQLPKYINFTDDYPFLFKHMLTIGSPFCGVSFSFPVHGNGLKEKKNPGWQLAATEIWFLGLCSELLG